MQRVYDNGHVYEGVYEGWYCPRCADFNTERELGPGQHLPDPRDPARARARGELVLPALRLPGATSKRLYEERPDFVVPDFRRNEALSFIKRGLEDVSLSRPKLKWGMPLPWDPEQRDVRLVRRAAQLRTPRSRFAREGEDLTERYWPADLHVHRQGHPQVPRRDLARAPDRGRARAAAADGHPRLPADGREEDVEVARQRARPVRGDRPLRRRRAALLLLPRGHLRPGRLASPRPASRRATRPSSPTTGATSPAADPGDGRALPRRGRPGRAPDPALAEGDEGSPGSTARRRAARPGRADPGAGGRSGRGCGGSTATSRSRGPGTWPRTRPTPSGSTTSSTTSPRGCGWWRCCCSPTCRETSASGCSRRSARADAGELARGCGVRASGGQRAVERCPRAVPEDRSRAGDR